MEAIERRDVDAARAALAAGARVGGSVWAWLIARREPTPLMAAVRTGSTEMVELLLDHGADPDRDTAVWDTPLAIASYHGDRAMIELLLDRGASVHPPRPRHAGALEMAAWYSRTELVAFLLERGADPDRVLSRAEGSLMRVQPPILAMLVAAGGHASPSIVSIVEAEVALRERRGHRPKQ